jgi:hypothetical protein
MFLDQFSCGDQKIDFVYSRPIYDISTLEILMQASVKFSQALNITISIHFEMSQA